VLFTQDSVPGLADGSITLTFRTWTAPRAKAGGRHRFGGLLLEIDAVERVDVDSIGDADARRAGYASADALRAQLAGHRHRGRVWRVAFRCAGADDRIARRNDAGLDPDKLARIEARLARMDRAASAGPWTRNTLALIAARPAVVSSVLARRMKMDRAAFKINVRKLKELGLTESLEIGYRLSPLGEAFVRASARGAA
jgi:hypothetical protein